MNSLVSIGSIGMITNLFIFLDKTIGYQWSHPYYAVHAIHNAMMVGLTAEDVWNTVVDFRSIDSAPTNFHAVHLCVALHLYHFLLYWRSFRFDDWIHHILMIGVAIPFGLYAGSHTLMGFSLFFTTGLPGGIDYGMLFGVRNGWIDRMTEKRINTFLNVWIRSPGCVAQAILTCVVVCSNGSYAGLVPAFLNYWNGQYFMSQVVSDYAIQTFD